MRKLLCVLCVAVLITEIIGVDGMKRHRRYLHTYHSVRNQFNDRPEASVHRILFPATWAQLKTKSNHGSKSNQSDATYDEPTYGVPYIGGPGISKRVKHVKGQYNGKNPRNAAMKCGDTYKEIEINYTNRMKEVVKLSSDCVQQIYD